MNTTNTERPFLVKDILRLGTRALVFQTAFGLALPLFASEVREAAPGPEARPAATYLKRAAKKPPRRTARPRSDAYSAKDNALLYATMEDLETLSSLHENLGLRVSTETLKKVLSLDRTVKSAAASYFSLQPKTTRENPGNYRALVDSALRSLRIFKSLKARLEPAAAGTVLRAARDLHLAVGADLTSRNLIPVLTGPGTPAGTTAPAVNAAPANGGEDLANQTETLVAISEVTFALSAYRKEKGRFPGKLKDLTPTYIPAIPTIAIAGHPGTDKTVDIDSADHDADISKALKDTGAWLYFSNRKSKYYGRVFVDCTHRNAQGVEFYRIGSGQ